MAAFVTAFDIPGLEFVALKVAQCGASASTRVSTHTIARAGPAHYLLPLQQPHPLPWTCYGLSMPLATPRQVSEGEAACCFTWKVVVNGQDGPQGLSFYQVTSR